MAPDLPGRDETDGFRPQRHLHCQGKIEEVGYFMAYAGQASAAYRITDEIVYTVDYTGASTSCASPADGLTGQPRADQASSYIRKTCSQVKFSS